MALTDRCYLYCLLHPYNSTNMEGKTTEREGRRGERNTKSRKDKGPLSQAASSPSSDSLGQFDGYLQQPPYLLAYTRPANWLRILLHFLSNKARLIHTACAPGTEGIAQRHVFWKLLTVRRHAIRGRLYFIGDFLFPKQMSPVSCLQHKVPKAQA